MMATFISWVRTLVIASFLITFVKLLLPEGQLRPYVRLVLHFILLAVFIQPLAHMNMQRFPFTSLFTTSEHIVADTDRWIQLGQQIQMDSRELAEDYVSKHIAMQMEMLITLVPDIRTVRVDEMRVMEDNIQFVALTIEGDKRLAEKSVLQLLQTYFALHPSDVVMNWQVREESVHANVE